MLKLGRRVGAAAKRAAKEAELQVLAAEGRRSLKAKVARAKHVTRKALRAGAIAGVVTAVSVVLRERKKRRALET